MTAAPTVLISTWDDGVFVFSGGEARRELAGRRVTSLVDAGQGRTLALVDGRELARRSPDGGWTVLARSDAPLACVLDAAGFVYVGTDEARLLRLDDHDRLVPLPGFDAAPGRETWFAGSMVVDGQRLGPPLGIRTLARTADGAALLANVHVGGVPRSLDGGATWEPTLDIAWDAHEVTAHPTRAELVICACAVGLAVSRDGGATWELETEGLHASYTSAAAFLGDDLLVAASSDHFAKDGALYRRSIDGGALRRVVGGLPDTFGGIVDTECIATFGTSVAVADSAGNAYRSDDGGERFAKIATTLPTPSSVHLLPAG